MKEIPNHPLYFASENGRIYRQRGKLFRQLTQIIQPYGKYLSVYIIDINGEKTIKQVHKLVASAYYNINPDEFEITHIDGNIFNNTPSNLRIEKVKKTLEKNDCYEKKTMISEYEKLLLMKINCDRNHPLWKKYERIKETKKYKNIYNWLYVHTR